MNPYVALACLGIVTLLAVTIFAWPARIRALVRIPGLVVFADIRPWTSEMPERLRKGHPPKVRGGGRAR